MSILDSLLTKLRSSNGSIKPEVAKPLTVPHKDPIGINDPLIDQKPLLWIYPGNTLYAEDPDGGKKILDTPNNKPVGVVIHHTVTYNLKQTIEYFKTNEVDIHFLIDKDGSVIQMVPCNKTAAHAGESSWAGYKYLNNYFIGIEIINIGPLTLKEDRQLYDCYNKRYIGECYSRKAFGYEYWAAFTDQQHDSLVRLCGWLKDYYKISPDNFVAHYEVSPGRKNDPMGMKTYPMSEFRDLLKKY